MNGMEVALNQFIPSHAQYVNKPLPYTAEQKATVLNSLIPKSA